MSLHSYILSYTIYKLIPISRIEVSLYTRYPTEWRQRMNKCKERLQRICKERMKHVADSEFPSCNIRKVVDQNNKDLQDQTILHTLSFV